MKVIEFVTEFDVQLQLSTSECDVLAKALATWADGLPNVPEQERALVQSCGTVLEVCSLALVQKAAAA